MFLAGVELLTGQVHLDLESKFKVMMSGIGYQLGYWIASLKNGSGMVRSSGPAREHHNVLLDFPKPWSLPFPPFFHVFTSKCK